MVIAKEVICIIGSSGRIGMRVAHKFADPRFLVVGLDSVRPRITTANFEFYACDSSSQQSVASALQQIGQKHGMHIASLVHIPGDFAPSGQQKEAYQKVIVEPTWHVMKALSSFQVDQYLFLSSIFVYKPCQPGQRMKEHWPSVPAWGLPEALVEAEEYVKAHHGTMPLVLLRLAACYDDMCHYRPLAEQIQRIYENSPLAIFFPGNSKCGTAGVHFDDVADAVWLTVQRRLRLPNEIAMIVSEPETLSYEELQKQIGILCTKEAYQTWAIPKALAKFCIRMSEKFGFLPKTDLKEWMIDLADLHYACDIGFIQEKLGWTPKHTLVNTLPRMIASLKENPGLWYRENHLKLPETKK